MFTTSTALKLVTGLGLVLLITGCVPRGHYGYGHMNYNNHMNNQNYGMQSNQYSNEPLQILQKRFVNGDISEEEYISKKNLLAQ